MKSDYLAISFSFSFLFLFSSMSLSISACLLAVCSSSILSSSFLFFSSSIAFLLFASSISWATWNQIKKYRISLKRAIFTSKLKRKKYYNILIWFQNLLFLIQHSTIANLLYCIYAVLNNVPLIILSLPLCTVCNFKHS